MRADGELLFFRDGALHAVRDLAVRERLEIRPASETRYALKVVESGGRMFFAHATNVWGAGPTLVTAVELD